MSNRCGNSSVGRARPCQGRGREFESRFPLQSLFIVRLPKPRISIPSSSTRLVAHCPCLPGPGPGLRVRVSFSAFIPLHRLFTQAQNFNTTIVNSVGSALYVLARARAASASLVFRLHPSCCLPLGLVISAHLPSSSCLNPAHRIPVRTPCTHSLCTPLLQPSRRPFLDPGRRLCDRHKMYRFGPGSPLLSLPLMQRKGWLDPRRGGARRPYTGAE